MSTSTYAAAGGIASSSSSSTIALPLRGGGDDDDDIIITTGDSELLMYGDPDLAEVGHVVLTAHPPGAVSTSSVRCHFLSPTSNDVVIVKSNRIEVRTIPRDDWINSSNNDGRDGSNETEEDTFPLSLILPINGRVVAIAPIRFGGNQGKKRQQDCLFFLTEGGSYALISYDASLTTTTTSSSSSVMTTTANAAAASSDTNTTTTTNTTMSTMMTGEHYPILTHASGRLPGHNADAIHPTSRAECGPLLCIDAHMRCMAVHVMNGHVVIFPINHGYNVNVDGKARRMPWRKNNNHNNNNNSTTGGGGARSNNNRGGINSTFTKRPFNDIIDMRIEERTILSMTFLIEEEGDDDVGLTLVYHPQLTILHQDGYGYQHVSTHGIDVLAGKLIPYKSIPNNMGMIMGSNNNNNRGSKRPSSSGVVVDLDTKLPAVNNTPIMPIQEKRLSLSKVEGGSGMLIAIPPMKHPPTATTSNDSSMMMMMMMMSQPSPQSSSPLTKLSSSSSTTTKTLGGVLILGQRLVTYYSPHGANGGAPVTLKTNTGGAGLLLSYCRLIDDDDTNVVERMNRPTVASIRYLIGDEYGRIHLLTLAYSNVDNETNYDSNNKQAPMMTMTLDVLGTTSTASSLSYLTNNRFFVGSAFGNSQLVQILDSPVSVSTSTSECDDAVETGGKTVGREEDAAGEEHGLLLTDMTYLKVLEEYDNLGPIVDFDLRPCGDVHTPSVEEGNRPCVSSGRHRQSLIVTCSGVGNDGSIRLVRNGVGMRENASVEMGGIVGMWSLRRKFTDVDDSFLVQSFVRETRVLGVQNVKDVIDDVEGGGEKNEMEIEEDQDEVGGALAEVTIPGFNSSKSTLFAGNVLVGKFDLLLQVVEDDVRLIDSETLASIAHWSPLSDSDACGDDDDDDDDEPAGFITVASANQCGQIIVALRGGMLIYLLVEGEDIPTIRRVRKVTLDREISCVDLNPFGSSSSQSSLIGNNNDIMDVDGIPQTRKSQLVAVGLWDDFSVRLLNLVGDPSSFLEQVLHINLGRGGGIDGLDSDERNCGVDGGQHMMARSLCLVTLDSHATTSNSSINKNTSPAAAGLSVDMLLVGLGDGKLISFVVNQTGSPFKNGWSIHSRKEVSLGTQGVHLIPFHHGSSKSSGSCVLATGDRPTIAYLTGNAGSNSNPKLNYSTISLTVDDDDDEVGHASHKNISVNVAAPFRSSLLFSMSSANGSSIVVADDSTLRLGMIDNIQKLHVTSFKLGMTPRRIAYHEAGRVYCVGCIADLEQGGEANQNNVIRFFDDSTFEELNW